jgi:hypothetical protein
MITLRDVIFFLAGAEFFHTLSHIFLAYFVTFPLAMKSFHFTSKMNFWAIIINLVVTILLVIWAVKLPR